jgi:hypothetical protein
MNRERAEKLFEMGLRFDGEQFTYPYRSINVHHTDVLCMSDETFNNVVEEIKGIIQEHHRSLIK